MPTLCKKSRTAARGRRPALENRYLSSSASYLLAARASLLIRRETYVQRFLARKRAGKRIACCKLSCVLEYRQLQFAAYELGPSLFAGINQNLTFRWLYAPVAIFGKSSRMTKDEGSSPRTHERLKRTVAAPFCPETTRIVVNDLRRGACGQARTTTAMPKFLQSSPDSWLGAPVSMIRQVSEMRLINHEPEQDCHPAQ